MAKYSEKQSVEKSGSMDRKNYDPKNVTAGEGDGTKLSKMYSPPSGAGPNKPPTNEGK